MFAPVYLDNNATTPLDERVLEAMLPFMRERFGNPSSRHEYGRRTRDAIDRARQQVAAAVNAHPTEVVFTSGGSEANNLFLKGAAACLPKGVLAVGAGEHPCIRQPALQLQREGWKLIELALDEAGRVDQGAVLELMTANPSALVSVMMANNETGVLNDIVTLARAARSAACIFHSDAVQALGKQPVDFRELGVHALSLSSHKINGPLGAGALVVDKRVELQPLIAGGGHERGLRSGTENVAAIVGFGLACECMNEELQARTLRMREMQQRLEQGLHALGAVVFGEQAARLPNTSFFAFPGIDGETLVGKLDRVGYALASGAACSSTNPEPSRNLLAMKVAPELARGAVRLSSGKQTTMNEIEGALAALGQTVKELRNLTAMVV